jgi:hypothetical protein
LLEAKNRLSCLARIAATLALLWAVQAEAANQRVLGKKLVVKDPAGTESARSLVAIGKETASDIASLVGDPVTHGASLRVLLNGATGSGQNFTLDAGGWSATATGFKYSGPTAADGDPVKRVVLKRTASGTVLLKAVLRGGLGTQSLDLTPPDPGSDAAVTLAFHGGGDVYCVSLGGAAGGTVAADTQERWQIGGATAEPDCPTVCCAFDSGFGEYCSWGVPDESICAQLGATVGEPGSVCDPATGQCTAPTASPGLCCDIAGVYCLGGPVLASLCSEVGTLVPGALCDPELSCVSP